MTGFISIREIMDNISDHPLLRDVTFERIVNHAVHFIRIVGMPDEFIEKTDTIHIEDYRGKLPCDFHEMIQVRTRPGCGDFYEVFRYTTDSFHMSDRKQESFDLTYKIQNSIIFTSMKEGDIEIAYRAINVDDEGYPLIPDNSSFIKALELYVKKQVFTVLFDLGRISPQVYNNTCQEYSWYVGQAQSDLVRPSIDEMESISNMLNTLVPRVSEHKSGFVNNGTKERMISHG